MASGHRIPAPPAVSDAPTPSPVWDHADRGRAHQRARLHIQTSPSEVSIYLNGAFRGRTDHRGNLVIADLPPGRYRLRARKLGTRERHLDLRLAPGEYRRLGIILRPTGDPAELAYQRGEQWREEKKYRASLSWYRLALQRRTSFPEAHVGLARSFLALHQYDEAQAEAEAAIGERQGVYPEGYTVLGRALHGKGLYEEALAAYRRALRQAGNFSPEAHAGLALVLDDMDEPERAIVHMRMAIEQNGDAEPTLYNLLGNMLLRIEALREAIAAFQTYLNLAPQSDLAPAIRSLVDQLRAEMNESQ